MSRKVFVTSDMSDDERLMDVADQDPQAALMWPWFLTALDDWGRVEASPRRLKVQVFPANSAVTVECMAAALEIYAKAGLLTLYEVDGKRYASVDQEKWFRYQTHIRQEKREQDRSHCPAPPARESGDSRDDSRRYAQSRADDGESQPSPTPSLSLPPSLSPSLSVDVPDGTLSAKADGPDPEREVYAHFKAKIQPRSRTFPRKKVAARLKRFTVDELKRGIDHFAADPWWMEHNASQGAAWFFASDDRSERFLLMSPRASPNGHALVGTGISTSTVEQFADMERKT